MFSSRSIVMWLAITSWVNSINRYGHSPMLTDAEFDRRKPVWTAFSEFWLDIELDDSDLQHIAKTAIVSGYSIAELREIYLYEVAPVVYPNLIPVAGQWAGFDEHWLHAEARKRADHRSLWLRFVAVIGIGGCLMTHATERYWKRITSLISIGTEGLPPCGRLVS